MRVSLNWLSDYVDLHDLTPEQVAAAFTDIGLEAEGIERQTAFQGDVVVGQVLTAVKHPNADTLRVCMVEVGEAEPLQIVCGAPNARAGIKVVVAKGGAVLPGDFKIKKSKIRGELSNGMLCSEKELQLSESHDGIIELPEAAPVGGSAAAALGLGDTILELNVTPNRADCHGMIGLARDLAAKLRRPLKLPDVAAVRRDQGTRTQGTVSVHIESPDGCPRFVAVYVSGVSIVPSPAWLQKRLVAAGMRPINLVVDATNYAMLEYSQPVHAYDERFVAGRALAVRAATAGEALVTLDGQNRQLEAGDLLICDQKGPIGLAGIMGGASSEVRPDTRAVIIEVAAFNARQVRRTGRRLGLHTEASHRFERGIDVDNLPTVALRVAGLLAQGAAEAGLPLPKIAVDVVDAYPADIDKRVVALRLSHARQFLGLPTLSRDEVLANLKALEFELLDSTDDRMVFEVPFFRLDVDREVDLVEEVGRLHGFDKIPYQLPVMNIRPTPEDPFIDFQEAARTAMAAAGFRETATFPFNGAAELAALGLAADHPYYPTLSLANPLSEAFNLLQASLLPGLLRALATNRRHGDRGARLFEAGRGYFDQNPTSGTPARTGKFPTLQGLSRPGRHLSRQARSDAGRPSERHWLAAVLDQPFAEKSWDAPAAAATFFHGKAAVLGLVRAMGAPEPQFARIDALTYPFLNPGAAATVTLGGKLAGYVGELHPRAAADLGLSDGGAPVVLELDLEVLFDAKGKGLRTAEEPRRFPPVTRDLAFLVSTERTHADFEGALAKFKRRQHLVRANLFDVYSGANLPADKKSMAYSFAFQSPERTLTDHEVEQEITALIAWLGESLAATLR